MRNVKGFIEISALANNTQNTVGQFGELSTYAETFSREKGYYANTVSTDVRLVTFKTTNDANAFMVIPNTPRDFILLVAQWVYDQYKTQAIPLETSHSVFVGTMETEFPTIAGLVVGPLVEGTAGSTYNMPEYVNFTYNDGTNDYQIALWFMDSAFRTQYDEFEIFVIPPVETGSIDLLNQAAAAVGTLLGEFTTIEKFEAAQTIQAGNPPTEIRGFNLVWHDPFTPGITLNTDWIIVIYGPQGNNNDNILTAIQDYITANTALLTSVWITIYPALYEQKEFVIIPLWDHLASPETLVDYGLYSPTINHADIRAIAQTFTPPQYNEEYNLSNHLDTNTNVSTSVYRSLAFIAVANPANSAGIITFKLAFPDYMAIPPSNVGDFSRMTADTQAIVLLFIEMFNIALTLSPASATPPGYSKITRNGILYLAKDHTDEVQYLVVTKHSYDANI